MFLMSDRVRCKKTTSSARKRSLWRKFWASLSLSLKVFFFTWVRICLDCCPILSCRREGMQWMEKSFIIKPTRPAGKHWAFWFNIFILYLEKTPNVFGNTDGVIPLEEQYEIASVFFTFVLVYGLKIVSYCLSHNYCRHTDLQKSATDTYRKHILQWELL